MKFEIVGDIHLRRGGGGGDPRSGMCVMEYVSWMEGAEVLTDHPQTACPSLRDFAIMLNDSAPTQKLRDTLLDFAPRLLNSRSPDQALRRALHLALESSVRVIARIDADSACMLRAAAWAEASRHRDSPELAAELIMLTAAEAPVAAMMQTRGRRSGARLRGEMWCELRAILAEALALGQTIKTPKAAKPRRRQKRAA